jgi:hypothetical protein
METGVDLVIILNLKKAYDRKVELLKESMNHHKSLVKKLNTINLESSVEDVREVFKLVTGENHSKQMIAIAAFKLFQELKAKLTRLTRDLTGILDVIVDQFVALENRHEDQKILRRIFHCVFNDEQVNQLNYRLLRHPRFLRLARREP